jgi:ATP/ADP translocase
MIVTSCGAEALPLISAFGVLPASVAFIMYYDKLVRLIADSNVAGVVFRSQWRPNRNPASNTVCL